MRTCKRILQVAILATVAVMLDGCSKVALRTTFPDGTVVELESTIFFQNREIHGESAGGAWFSSKIGNEDAAVVINNGVREARAYRRGVAAGR